MACSLPASPARQLAWRGWKAFSTLVSSWANSAAVHAGGQDVLGAGQLQRPPQQEPQRRRVLVDHPLPHHDRGRRRQQDAAGPLNSGRGLTYRLARRLPSALAIWPKIWAIITSAIGETLSCGGQAQAVQRQQAQAGHALPDRGEHLGHHPRLGVGQVLGPVGVLDGGGVGILGRRSGGGWAARKARSSLSARPSSDSTS